MKLAILLASTLLAAVPAVAKPKSTVFDAPPDKVYAAVEKVAREHFVVTLTDEKQMLVSFKTPRSFTADPMEVGVTVEAENGKSKVTINIVKSGGWGAATKSEDNIIKWIGEELKP